MSDITELIKRAAMARDKAYAPYSRHPVGAAILGANGKIYIGCNVENAAYPLGVCAEQSAISAMILDGERTIESVVVVGPVGAPCTPCGGCRQRIREFATPETLIHAASAEQVLLTMKLGELLPASFGPENLPDL